MKAAGSRDEKLLLKMGQAVVEELRHRVEGTSLRPRWPRQIGVVNTDGWRVKIGDLGKGRPSLQIWLDHFAGHKSRKFSFCFCSDNPKGVRLLADRAAKHLPLHRRITHKDTERVGFYFLRERLRRNEFGEPILEEYWGKWSYYGIYDFTLLAATGVTHRLVARAASFFESVARTLPRAKPEGEEHEVYPQLENRKIVTSHLRRERSRYLATECKDRDDYECQVCGLRFEDVYGKLGEWFAEAHHRLPLHLLTRKVKTRVKDLATVCANCHRMLHRMDGNRNDVEKLKAIVRKRKRGRKERA